MYAHTIDKAKSAATAKKKRERRDEEEIVELKGHTK